MLYMVLFLVKSTTRFCCLNATKPDNYLNTNNSFVLEHVQRTGCLYLEWFFIPATAFETTGV